jgi:hypothetical protein
MFILRYMVTVALLVTITLPFASVPDIALAQSRNRGSWDSWWEGTREGESPLDEEAFEELYKQRRQSSSLRRKVNALDDDPVDNLSIPILFGVAVNNLYPNFGDPRDGGSRTHKGFDMLAPVGTPVVSPTEAVVIRIGRGTSAGNYVYTANPGDETFAYMHLDEIADDLESGDELAVGGLIGFVGNTGNASGGPAHLHFEIREGRNHTDPFPRLTAEFALEDKMEFVEEMFDGGISDEEAFAIFLVTHFSTVFLNAQMRGIELPEEIENALSERITTIVRDLDIGSQGDDVTALQSILIAEGHLAISTPTGYFGPLTQTALQAYQRAHGIVPASGYFGPITRAYLRGSGTSGDVAMIRKQLIEKIAELTELIEKLQAEQDGQ